MTSELHNLDEGISEYFQFVLGGFTYKMKYPNTKEIVNIAAEKNTEKQMDLVYSFITSSEESAPKIKDALTQANIKVLQRFNAMIKKEFLDNE